MTDTLETSKKKYEKCHPLLAEIILWIEGTTFQHKQCAFDRIKRKMLKDDLKRMHKNNFQSISNSSVNGYLSTSMSNYVSITDFKPIDHNYSSIKIIDYQTHGVKNDIKTCLAKRIQYTASQIFNKDQFLQSWMIRQKSIDFRPQNYPISDYATKKINSYHQQALSAVKRFTFSQFCKINLKRRGGMFSFTQRNPLQFKKTDISSSLTHLPDIQNQTAVQAFQILLRAGGQMSSQFNHLYQINQLIELAMTSDDNIKQQIFFQVIKQMSSRKEIYLRILCCLCYSVKISSRMYISLLNFMYQQASLYQSLPKQLLNYCFFHLIRNFDKQKKHPPSFFQLFCAFHAFKIPIKVSFPKQKVFFIESYTTVQEFMQQLIQYYNLDASVQYLLQINGFLMQKGNLLDNLNFYSIIDIQNYKWKDYQSHKGLFALIVLKNVQDINNSAHCFNIMYNYCANQYLRGLYALKSIDIVKIAALKLHSQLQKQQSCIFQYQNLISRRKLKILTTKQDLENYKKHIVRHYFKIRHLKKIQARKQIIQMLSKSKGFNTHFFKSQISVDEYDNFVAWVGAQPDKFIIVQPSTGRLVKNIPYSSIKQWGKSKSELCLRIDNVGLFHIDTRQVDVLVSVFEQYLSYQQRKLRN